MADKAGAGRPRRLGRGLSALVDSGSRTPPGIDPPTRAVSIEPGNAVPTSPDEVAPASDADRDPAGGNYVWVMLDSVVPGAYQPRRSFDEEALRELAASITRSGVIQPIVVRPTGAGGHELISGERRWRAARLAGLERIPAIVRDATDREAAEWAIVENVQREDLDPVERARAFKRLADEFGQTHEQIAQAVGVKRPTVANLIRVLDLDEEILALLSSGALTTGHAKALLSEPDAGRRRALAAQAAEESWSVRRLEQAVSGQETPAKPGPNAVPAERSPAVLDLEKRLSDHLGTKVGLKTDASGTSGRVSIAYYSLDHFDELMRRLGMPPTT